MEVKISKSDFLGYMKSKDKLFLAKVDFFIDNKFRLVAKVSFPENHETHFPLFLHSLDEYVEKNVPLFASALDSDLQSIFDKMEGEKQ